jgi:hypothetical protein
MLTTLLIIVAFLAVAFSLATAIGHWLRKLNAGYPTPEEHRKQQEARWERKAESELYPRGGGWRG